MTTAAGKRPVVLINPRLKVHFLLALFYIETMGNNVIYIVSYMFHIPYYFRTCPLRVA